VRFMTISLENGKTEDYSVSARFCQGQQLEGAVDNSVRNS